MMMSLAYAINDLSPIKKESSLALKLKGDMHFSKATHQATISQGVDIKITNTNKPSSEIKRGEAQSQTQNFINGLGKPLGETLQKNHNTIGSVIKESVKEGNTFISNGYIQSTDSSKPSSLKTDRLVHQDIGNVKFENSQGVNVSGIVTPLYIPEALIRLAKDAVDGKNISWTSFGINVLDSIHPSLSIEGNPIHTETSKNNSSISNSIQITSSNQSNITRGDKQEKPSDVQKGRIQTQLINIKPSKIIEEVMKK